MNPERSFENAAAAQTLCPEQRRCARFFPALLASLSLAACVSLPEAPVEKNEPENTLKAASTAKAATADTARPENREPALRADSRIDTQRAARKNGSVAEEATVAPDFSNNVYFAAGSTEIDARGRSTLQAWAEKLKANRDQRVALTGHTDHLGSREYNISLGQKRVEEVLRELISLGVWSRQIVRRTSYGNEAVKTPACRSAECRQTLRRVELGS